MPQLYHRFITVINVQISKASASDYGHPQPERRE
jgi:hypothetical protein